MTTTKNRVRKHRKLAQAKGAVIVYALITDPEAIKAWKQLQELYGNNRNAIEACIIDSYEDLLRDS